MSSYEYLLDRLSSIMPLPDCSSHLEPIGNGKCFCTVCDPNAARPMSCRSVRNCKGKGEVARFCRKGAGTELKAIFAFFRIHPNGGCNCEAIADEMDQRGPDWCEENMESLIDQIEAESKKRRWAKYVFSRIVARRMIRLAIKRARRKEQKKDTII